MRCLYAQLHFPELALEALGSDYQITKIAVHDGQKIIQASEQALNDGIFPGMTLNMAITLSPLLNVRPQQPKKQEQLLYRLAHWAYQYSHQVAIRNHGLCLEVAKSEQLFGALPEIYNALTQSAKKAGRPMQLAFGHTPEMADIFLKQGICPLPNTFQKCLERTTIEVCEISQAHIQRLNNMGFRTLKDYFEAPGRARQKRLPRIEYQYLEAVSGQHLSPLKWFEPPPLFDQSIEFFKGLENEKMLRLPMERLTQEAENWLRKRQMATSNILWDFKMENGHDTPLRIRLNQPETHAQAFIDPSSLKLAHCFGVSPIIAVRLRIQEIVQTIPKRNDLFLKYHDSDRHQLIDRLKARLGEQAITTPCRIADPRPEKANQCLSKPQSAKMPILSPRPIWLIKTPLALGSSPEKSGYQLLQGPERIETGWWDSEPTCRSYWISLTKSDRVAWIYQDLHHKTWWLAGWFA